MTTYTFNPTDAAASIITTVNTTSTINDEFVFNDGEYRDLVSLTPKAGQTFRAAANAKVVINGGRALSSWSVHSGSIYKHSYTRTIDKVLTVGEYTIGNKTGYERAGWNITVIADGEPLQHRNTLSGLTTGQFCYDDDGSLGGTANTLYLGEDPGNYDSLEVTHHERLATISVANVAFINLTIKHYAAAIQESPVYVSNITTGNGLVMTNVTSTLNDGLGVRYGSGFTARGCRFVKNGMAGYSGQGDDILFECCEIDENNYLWVNTGFEGGGGKWSRGQRGMWIGCTFRANNGKAWWTDLECINPIVCYCTFTENYLAAIFHELSGDGAFYRNTLVHNCLGIDGDNPYKCALMVTNSQRYNNPHILIFSNTVVVAPAGITENNFSGGGIGVIQANRTSQTATLFAGYVTVGVRVFDNDIYNTDSGRSGMAANWHSTGTASDWYGVNDVLYYGNRWHRPVNASSWQYNEGNITAFGTWQTNGQDTTASGGTTDTASSPSLSSFTHQFISTPNYQDYIKSLPGTLCYFPMDEASGTVSQNLAVYNAQNTYDGAYTNVTLAATGKGDGKTAASFVAASAGRMIVSTTNVDTHLLPNLDFDEVSISVWVKMDAAMWIDGVVRGIVRLGNTTAAGQGMFRIQKTTANVLEFYASNGTTSKTVTHTTTTTDWMHLVLTYNRTAGEMKAYVNGAQVGTTQTSLGAGGATSLSSVFRVGSTTGSSSGNITATISDVLICTRHTFSQADVTRLYQWNQAVIVNQPAAVTADEGDAVEITLVDTHADTGQTITWSLEGAPDWLSIDTDGVITGTIPDIDAAEDYYFRAVAADNGTPARATSTPITINADYIPEPDATTTTVWQPYYFVVPAGGGMAIIRQYRRVN